MKKTAIITGGTRGIGFAIAKQLAKDGFNIVVTGTKPETEYCGVLAQLEEAGAEYMYVASNVASPQDRKMLVEKAVLHFGGIHLLVNNAGVAPLERADLLDMSEESFDRVVGINTKGTLFLSQEVAKQMLNQPIINQKRGTIINVSSCSSAAVSINRGEYCVSKAAVSMVTQLFAQRLAAEGILVHEVRPGVIATDMTTSVQEKYDEAIKLGKFPIARWGTPEDVAGAVSAFASDKFLYSTGNHIDVDGGFHIRSL